MTNSFDIIHIRDYYPSVENPASSPWVYDQVKDLAANNISSLVVSPTPYVPSFLKKGERFYLYPKPSKKIETFKNTKVIRPVYWKIPANKMLWFNFKLLAKSLVNGSGSVNEVKLIHAHFGQNGIAALELKKKYKVPLVTSFYGYDAGRLGRKFQPYYAKLIENGDVFLALSNDMKKDLITLGFPADKILIHHLGINLQKFNSKPKDANSKFTFLIVARLDESKGLQHAIRAFKKINRENTDLRIVGDGVYKNALQDLVNELNINEKVSFINNFKMENPRKVVLDEMQNCDVAMLTSFMPKNKAKEGTPVVLMEAQACAKPCIATDHAGIPEVVIDQQTGFIVKEKDIDAIAEKMIFFIDHPKKVTEFGMQARNYITNEFNQEKQMKKLISIYNSLNSSIK